MTQSDSDARLLWWVADWNTNLYAAVAVLCYGFVWELKHASGICRIETFVKGLPKTTLFRKRWLQHCKAHTFACTRGCHGCNEISRQSQQPAAAVSLDPLPPCRRIPSSIRAHLTQDACRAESHGCMDKGMAAIFFQCERIRQ
jgi:hypothetical protein